MSDQVDKLLREIQELRNALKGRTVSCVFCNNTAKERDEAIREREEIRAMMVTLCHRVVNDATREASDDETN